MALIVKMRQERKVAGVVYARGQVVDIEAWSPRLARLLAEQNAFVDGPGAALVEVGVRPGGADLGLRAALEAKDARLREQLTVEHKGHRAPTGDCESPRCAFLREVLAIGADAPKVAVAA